MSARSSGPRSRSRNGLTGTPATVGVMAAIAAVALAVLVSFFGSVLPLAVAVGAGSLLAGTMTAASYQNPLGRALTSSGAVLSGLGLVGTVGLPFVFASPSVHTGLYAIVSLCVCFSVFGVFSTATGSFGDRTLLRTVPILIVTGVAVGLAGFGLQLRAAPAVFFTPLSTRLPSDGIQQAVATVRQALFTPTDPLVGVTTFGVLCCGWLISVSRVLHRLPLRELAAQSNQHRVQQLRTRVSQLTRYGIVATIGLTPVLLLFATTPLPRPIGIDLTGVALPLAESLAARRAARSFLTDSSLLLWSLAFVTALPGLTRVSAGQLTRWLPVVTSGFGTLLAVSAVYPSVYRRVVVPLVEAGVVDGLALAFGLASSQPGVLVLGLLRPQGGLLTPPQTTVVAVAVIGLVAVVTLVCLLLSVAVGIGLLPRRVAPGGLAAGALFLAGTAAGLAGGSPISVVVVIGCAIMLWDVAEYGTTLRTELGSNAPARGLVATHTLGGLAVAGIGVIIAIGVEWGILSAVAISSQLSILILLVVALVGSATLLSSSEF